MPAALARALRSVPSYHAPPVGRATEGIIATAASWRTAALISADVWHWAPYFTFMLMGGLAAIPPETQEAARIDGASDWRVFFDVTLPQLAPVLTVAIILKSVFALKVFVFSGQLEDAGDFFSSFFVTGADAMRICIWVILIGAAIGFVGSVLGLRRFLRV